MMRCPRPLGLLWRHSPARRRLVCACGLLLAAVVAVPIARSAETQPSAVPSAKPAPRLDRSGQTSTTVFGVHAQGSRFVYVFDRSGSMADFRGRPLAAAKRELIRSLADLQDTNQFQIIFYNERPKVFRPRVGEPQLVWGNDAGKEQAERFVRGIQASGGTSHLDALRLALGMSPDVVFFLTDADEPRLSDADLGRVLRWNRGATIHCIEFGVGPAQQDENFLVRLARQNRGQHVYVDVSELASE